MHIDKKRFYDRNFMLCLIISRSMKICRDLTLNVSLTVKTSNENSMYTYEKSYFGILSLHAFFIKFNCNLQQCNGNTAEKVSILKGHGHDIGQISTSFFFIVNNALSMHF